MSDKLAGLMEQYATLQSERSSMGEDEYKTKAKRMRSLIRNAGGSVTSLTSPDGQPVERAPRAQRPAKASKELREKSAGRTGKSTDEWNETHRTSTKGSSAPRYGQPVKGTAALADQIKLLEDELASRPEVRRRDYNALGRMGANGLGLGFIVFQGVPLNLYLEKYAARYPALKTPTWWALSRSSAEFTGGTCLLVLGPVDTNTAGDLGGDIPENGRSMRFDDEADGGETYDDQTEGEDDDDTLFPE